MSITIDEMPVHGIDQGESIPEMRPWREWAGSSRTAAHSRLSGRGDNTRARKARISQLRDQ